MIAEPKYIDENFNKLPMDKTHGIENINKKLGINSQSNP